MWIAPLVEDEAASLRDRCEGASENLEALEDVEPDLLGLTNRRAESGGPCLISGSTQAANGRSGRRPPL
jgi:hypothetical protein